LAELLPNKDDHLLVLLLVEKSEVLTLDRRLLTELDSESEVAASLVLRSDAHLSLKFIDYLFANVKAKTDSVRIHLTGRIQEPKELKKLGNVFFLNANSVVFHWNLESSVGALVGKQIKSCFDDWSGRRKLDGVALKVEEHLLKSKLIRTNQLVVLETLELCQNGDIVGDQLLLLDFDDFFYNFFQFKVTEILTELFGVYLSQCEHIVDAKYE
jgi:hypothetical protein